jgi:cytochrome c-type biogenesis protein CcmH
MIWIIFAIMTAIVIAVLILPVVRAKPSAQDLDRNAFDRAVFRDQLAELDRDVERSMIGVGEAEAARNEISRRLIAASAAPVKARPLRTPFLALLAALIIPAIAMPLYLRTGSPMLPDVPLATRLEKAAETGDYEA